MQELVWKHRRENHDDNDLGFVTVSASKAKKLIKAGVAQPANLGALRLKPIDRSRPPAEVVQKVVVSETPDEDPPVLEAVNDEQPVD